MCHSVVSSAAAKLALSLGQVPVVRALFDDLFSHSLLRAGDDVSIELQLQENWKDEVVFIMQSNA